MTNKELPLDIAKRAISGTFHVGLSNYAIQAIDFFRSIILARLLIPEYFGILSLATFYLYFFGMINSWGFNAALIHKKDRVEQALAGHFLLNTAMAVFIFLAVVLTSPFIIVKLSPNLMDQPQDYHNVLLVIRILAFLGIVQAIGMTPRLYMEKNLQFKAIAVIEIISMVLSTLIPLAMAVFWPSLYVLIVWRISASLVPSLLIWFFSPWRPTLGVDTLTIKWFFKFGVTLLPSAPLTLFFLKFDDYLAGTLCGLLALGLYSKAFSFSLIPLQFISTIVSRVAAPTYAKLQEDREELSKAFAYTTRNILRFSGLLSLLLPAVAIEFVLILLGDKWLGMVPVLRILFMYAWLRPLVNEFGVLCTAVGRPKYVPMQMFSMVVIIAGLGFWLTARFGINGLAIAVDLMILVGVFAGYFFCKNIVDIRLLRLLVPSVLAAGSSLIVLSLYSMTPLIMSNYANFFVKLGLVTFTYFFVIYLVDKKEIIFDLKYLMEIRKAES